MDNFTRRDFLRMVGLAPLVPQLDRLAQLLPSGPVGPSPLLKVFPAMRAYCLVSAELERDAVITADAINRLMAYMGRNIASGIELGFVEDANRVFAEQLAGQADGEPVGLLDRGEDDEDDYWDDDEEDDGYGDDDEARYEGL